MENQNENFENNFNQSQIESVVKENTEVNEEVSSDENLPAEKKSFTLIIIEVVLLLVVIALAVIYFTQKNKVSNTSEESPQSQASQNSQNVNIDKSINQSVETKQTPVTKVVPQTSTPSTPRKKTVAEEENLRMKLTPPAQSVVMTEESIPEGAIKISGTSNGFEPKEFTVKAGEEIILALTSRIDLPVVLTFYNNNMPPVSIGCGPRETRWVTLKAPNTKGEYIFKNDVIGHNNETGKMIVN